MTVADEFDWRRMNIDAWRIGVEGGIITQENKYSNVQRIRLSGLYIMISNHRPETISQLDLDDEVERSILERLDPIEAKIFPNSDKFLHEDVTCMFLFTPIVFF